MNTGNIKALIQALPQFRDILGRMSVHIFISRWGLPAARSTAWQRSPAADAAWQAQANFESFAFLLCPTLCGVLQVAAASPCDNSIQMWTTHVPHGSTGDFTCCPVHTAVCLSCSELKNAINGRMLTELGELEQNLVYGDMGSAELIKFLQGELGGGLLDFLPCTLLWRVAGVCLQADELVSTGRCSRMHTCAAGAPPPSASVTVAHASSAAAATCRVWGCAGARGQDAAVHVVPGHPP